MKYSKQGNKAQPGTADIQAALDKRKADTRKLHAEMQTIIANQHHPSCRQSDKDLVWHCAQCGLNESAEALQAHADKLAEALRAFLAVVRTSNMDRSVTKEGLTNCDAISVASAALAAYEESNER